MSESVSGNICSCIFAFPLQMKDKSFPSSHILAAFLMMLLMLSVSAERDYCPQPAIGVLQAKNLTDLEYSKR